ncbi:hypothetical protein PC9H_001916 [Pleurotus ostreatus]|uniref:Endopeptidase S2P n=1 Tax=Pleurotus ostreatus TaxID=5322 RepID=A0A8H7DKW9_PLEOS|nr:uncharacterized protein PC9H_001916 [Pleurotus ostreatus]KAF7419329.1 hypothetical protein PC9H_001916 [Pleurotus ostreatus]
MQIRTGALNNAHRRLRRRVRGSRVARGVYDVGSVCGVAGVVFGYYVIYSSFFASAPPSPSKRSLTLQPIIPGVTTPLSHLPIIVLCVVVCQCIHELGHAIAAAVENIPLLSAGLSLSSAFVALPPLAARCSLRGQLRIIAAGPFHNLLTFLLLAALPRLAALLPSTDLSHVGALVLSVDAHSVLRPYLPTGTVITHLDDYPLFHPSHPHPWHTYLLAPSPPTALSPYDSPPDTLPLHGWCLPSPQFLNAPTSCCDRSPSPHSPPDPSSHLACFDALNTTPSSRCIDPIPILTQPPLPPYPNLSPTPKTPYKRCSSARDCSGPQAIEDPYTCVLPRPAEHLLRITILASSPSNTSAQYHVQRQNTMQLQTLLWTGPRREIYDQVHTTQRLPFPFPPPLFLRSPNEGKWGWALLLSAYARLAPGARLLYTYVPSPTPSLLPSHLPNTSDHVVNTFKFPIHIHIHIFPFLYTSLASLSLYTLNLLPLPHLDGAHFLAALLTLLLAPSTNSANHPPDSSFVRNGGGGRGGGGHGGGWGDEDEDGDGDGETLLPLYRTTVTPLNLHTPPPPTPPPQTRTTISRTMTISPPIPLKTIPPPPPPPPPSTNTPPNTRTRAQDARRSRSRSRSRSRALLLPPPPPTPPTTTPPTPPTPTPPPTPQPPTPHTQRTQLPRGTSSRASPHPPPPLRLHAHLLHVGVAAHSPGYGEHDSSCASCIPSGGVSSPSPPPSPPSHPSHSSHRSPTAPASHPHPHEHPHPHPPQAPRRAPGVPGVLVAPGMPEMPGTPGTPAQRAQREPRDPRRQTACADAVSASPRTPRASRSSSSRRPSSATSSTRTPLTVRVRPIPRIPRMLLNS